MNQYVFTMTSRMVAIAATCVVLLCILLFLMGIEIGKQWTTPAGPPALSTSPVPPATAPVDAPPIAPKTQPSTF